MIYQFKDNYFNVCICNLSLNFFENTEKVIGEIYRVLDKNGIFYCSIPVPERNIKKSTIRGSLHSEIILKSLFERNGFKYEPLSFKNGAILYFKATNIKDKEILK